MALNMIHTIHFLTTEPMNSAKRGKYLFVHRPHDVHNSFLKYEDPRRQSTKLCTYVTLHCMHASFRVKCRVARSQFYFKTTFTQRQEINK